MNAEGSLYHSMEVDFQREPQTARWVQCLLFVLYRCLTLQQKTQSRQNCLAVELKSPRFIWIDLPHSKNSAWPNLSLLRPSGVPTVSSPKVQTIESMFYDLYSVWPLAITQTHNLLEKLIQAYFFLCQRPLQIRVSLRGEEKWFSLIPTFTPGRLLSLMFKFY